LRDQLASKRIALIASGGNASCEQLLDVLGAEHAMRTEALRETSLTGCYGHSVSGLDGSSSQTPNPGSKRAANV
jgi:hypothetical protein